MPFVLRDRRTERILEYYPGDYRKFIEFDWGGYYPYMLDGVLRSENGKIAGCYKHDAYWQEVAGKPLLTAVLKEKMWRLRQQAVGNGMQLLDEDEVLEEVRRRRGGSEAQC